MTTTPPPDRLTQTIGVLLRREVEARILAPVIAALGEEFGRERVKEIVGGVVTGIAHEQGRELAAEYGDSPEAFLETLAFWTKGGAIELVNLRREGAALDYDVTRCCYAEMYRALGIEDLGAILSCGRDASLIEGFCPGARLERAETIMDGAPACTFRYRFPDREA